MPEIPLSPVTPRWVAIQRNPSSGSGRRAGMVLDLIRELRVRGLVPRLYSRRADFDAAVRDPVRRASLVAVVAAGGDGTVLDLVNRHPDLPLCILPLGTENLLAKAFGIPRCGRTVARVVSENFRQRIDSAWINQRRFLIMASAGFDAEVVRQVQANRGGGHVRHWSYLGPIFRSLFHYSPATLRVTVDDQSPVIGELVVVANLRAYALNLGIVPTASGTDGQLDVRLFRIRSLGEMVRRFFQVIRGSHETCSEVVRLRGKLIRIESDSPEHVFKPSNGSLLPGNSLSDSERNRVLKGDPVPVQADGDPAGTTPVEIRVDPLSVEFIIPRPRQSD